MWCFNNFERCHTLHKLHSPSEWNRLVGTMCGVVFVRRSREVCTKCVVLWSFLCAAWVVAHLTPSQRSRAVGMWAMFRPHRVRRGASILSFCSQVSCHEWWSMCAAPRPIKFDTKFVFSRFVSCDGCVWFCCVVRVGVCRWIVCRSGSRRVSLCERMQLT